MVIGIFYWQVTKKQKQNKHKHLRIFTLQKRNTIFGWYLDEKAGPADDSHETAGDVVAVKVLPPLAYQDNNKTTHALNGTANHIDKALGSGSTEIYVGNESKITQYL